MSNEYKFCKNCKYHEYQYLNEYEPAYDCCKVIKKIEHNEIRQFKVYYECCELNKNNDCPYYNPSFWYRLLKYLGFYKI